MYDAAVTFRRIWWAVGVLIAVWSIIGDPWTFRFRTPYGAPPQVWAQWLWLLVEVRRDQVCWVASQVTYPPPRVFRVGFVVSRALHAVGL